MGSYTSIGIGGSQSHIEKLAEPMYQRPQNRTVSKIKKNRQNKFGIGQKQSSEAQKCFQAKQALFMKKCIFAPKSCVLNIFWETAK